MTWEPAENLCNCPEKLAEFEERERLEFRRKYGYHLKRGRPQVGVKFGHKCEKVLALHPNVNGVQPNVLVKWKGTDWQTIVTMSVARKHFIQHLIEHLELLMAVTTVKDAHRHGIVTDIDDAPRPTTRIRALSMKRKS